MPACTVNVELPPEVIEAGLSVADAPAGTPETARLTICGLPDVTGVSMVLVPLPPWAMVNELDEALMLKSAGALLVIATSSKSVYVASPGQLSSWLRRVSVQLWPPVRVAPLDCTQATVLLQVRANMVVVVELVLSTRVALAQS